jgi:hypothetical protein
MFLNDLFVMNFAKMTIPELTTWLLGTASLQEKHSFHGTTMPDWVPAWVRFRQHADCLTITAKAAENKDVAKSKERDDEQAAALQSININACYVIIRAKHENDDSLLHGMGYETKEKVKRTRLHQTTSISQVPLIVTAKRGPTPGSVVVNFQRDPGAGLYQLQICKGEPTGEESYGDGGSFKHTRTVVLDLNRASWYYFRGRSHGNNETSPWSAPVGIIVV